MVSARCAWNRIPTAQLMWSAALRITSSIRELSALPLAGVAPYIRG